MAYNNAIPAAGDLLSQSQADIQDNFAALKTLIDVNHGTFAAADEGKHKHITLPEQGADPTTLANEKAMYAKQSALSGVSELFIRNESDGTVTEFTSSTQAASGYTRLPSGILLKWGTSVVGADATANIAYESTIEFAAVYNASVTIQGQSGNAGACYVQSFDTISLTVYNASSSGGRTFYYFVIGI